MNADEEDRYTCPVTGAHFEFTDMCKRLTSVRNKRAQYEKKIGDLLKYHKKLTLLERLSIVETEPVEQSKPNMTLQPYEQTQVRESKQVATMPT